MMIVGKWLSKVYNFDQFGKLLRKIGVNHNLFIGEFIDSDNVWANIDKYITNLKINITPIQGSIGLFVNIKADVVEGQFNDKKTKKIGKINYSVNI